MPDRTHARLRLSPTTVTALQFAVSGMLVLVLVGVIAIVLVTRSAREEAIDDARTVTSTVGHGIVEPQLEPGITQLDPAAEQQLDRIVHAHVLTGSVVRVKLWRPDGTIVYSDEHALIGQRFTLGDDEEHVLRHGGAAAELSDLTRPENQYERHYGKLLEVYVQVKAPDGSPLLFETYLRYSAVEHNVHRLLWRFAPLDALALILLELVQVPLAISGARRLQAQRRERVRLLERAVDASMVERQRIARDLHDGVVQQLAGVSLGLHASAATVRASGATSLAERLEQSSADVRTSIRGLRTLLVEIHPPSLRSAGLEAALDDLASGLPARGVQASVSVDIAGRLPVHVEATLFRVAQEAVRNAERHARASTLHITLIEDDDRAHLTVRDDGMGFDPEGASAAGHFGLVLIRDLVAESGGVLTVTSRAGQGTTVHAEVPIDDE